MSLRSREGAQHGAGDGAGVLLTPRIIMQKWRASQITPTLRLDRVLNGAWIWVRRSGSQYGARRRQ